MGGHQAGEIASQFVTNELQARFEQENLIEESQAETWLRTTLKQINLELYYYAQEDPGYRGMGTTCVCALIFEKKSLLLTLRFKSICRQFKRDRTAYTGSFIC